MATFRYISVSAVIVAAFTVAGAAGDEALSVDGTTMSGRLDGAKGALAFRAGGKRVPLQSIARIVCGAFDAPVELLSGVRLAGGGVIRGPVEMHDDAVSVTSARLGALTFPLAQVAAVHFRKAGSAGGERGLALANGDFLACSTLRFAGGVFHAQSTIGHIEVPPERVAAAIFAERAPSGPVRVVLDNGDVLRGEITSAKPEALEFAAAGVRMAVPAEYIVRIDFTDRIRYLRADALGPEACDSDDGRSGADVPARPGVPVTVAFPQGARSLHFTARLSDDSRPPSAVFALSGGGGKLWSDKVTAGRPSRRVVLAVDGREEAEFLLESDPPGMAGVSGVWADAFVVIDGRGR